MFLSASLQVEIFWPNTDRARGWTQKVLGSEPGALGFCLKAALLLSGLAKVFCIRLSLEACTVAVFPCVGSRFLRFWSSEKRSGNASTVFHFLSELFKLAIFVSVVANTYICKYDFFNVCC